MSQISANGKMKKPTSKNSVITEHPEKQPISIAQSEIPSTMGRTRSGIHDSPERWGDRVFGSGDRKHPNAKPC